MLLTLQTQSTQLGIDLYIQALNLVRDRMQ